MEINTVKQVSPCCIIEQNTHSNTNTAVWNVNETDVTREGKWQSVTSQFLWTGRRCVQRTERLRRAPWATCSVWRPNMLDQRMSNQSKATTPRNEQKLQTRKRDVKTAIWNHFESFCIETLIRSSYVVIVTSLSPNWILWNGIKWCGETHCTGWRHFSCSLCWSDPAQG